MSDFNSSLRTLTSVSSAFEYQQNGNSRSAFSILHTTFDWATIASELMNTYPASPADYAQRQLPSLKTREALEWNFLDMKNGFGIMENRFTGYHRFHVTGASHCAPFLRSSMDELLDKRG
jgi:hypothetical protein